MLIVRAGYGFTDPSDNKKKVRVECTEGDQRSVQTVVVEDFTDASVEAALDGVIAGVRGAPNELTKVYTKEA